RRRQVWRLGSGEPRRRLGRDPGRRAEPQAAPACPQPDRGASGDKGADHLHRPASRAYGQDLGAVRLERGRRAREPLQGQLMAAWTAKRFWKQATAVACDGGFTVRLDERPVKTPAKTPLVVPTRALAEAIAAEWEAQ